MRTLIAATLILGLGGLTAAEDKKADPTGTWKWETERGGQKRETTLKLKLEGDKLTGTITAGRGKAEDVKIEDAKFKDGQVTFSVTRERGDMKIVTKYAVKADGDTLKGTATSERDGKEQKQEFEAKRQKVKD